MELAARDFVDARVGLPSEMHWPSEFRELSAARAWRTTSSFATGVIHSESILNLLAIPAGERKIDNCLCVPVINAFPLPPETESHHRLGATPERTAACRAAPPGFCLPLDRRNFHRPRFRCHSGISRKCAFVA